MKKNSYGVIYREPAKKGIYSLVLGLVATAGYLLLIAVAFISHGAAPVAIGALSYVLLAAAVIGLVLGIRSYHEPHKAYAVSNIGMVINGIVILGFVYVFIQGVGQ